MYRAPRLRRCVLFPSPARHRTEKVDGPTLPALFPHSHGLLTLHSFPTTHHLLPPTLKSSFLLGAGGNNLGFRLKRKRFVIETVHLGVEGGVGERRTEPAQEVRRMLAVAGKEQDGVGVEGVEGVEKVGIQGVEGVEKVGIQGVEKVGIQGVEKVQGGVGMPRGPKEEKKKRGKVRFGGEVEVTADKGGARHGHEHAHREGGKRPVVRHDRMDLYDF